MVELKHPISDLRVNKPSDVVARWEKAGWLRVKPKAEPRSDNKSDSK